MTILPRANRRAKVANIDTSCASRLLAKRHTKTTSTTGWKRKFVNNRVKMCHLLDCVRRHARIR